MNSRGWIDLAVCFLAVASALEALAELYTGMQISLLILGGLLAFRVVWRNVPVRQWETAVSRQTSKPGPVTLMLIDVKGAMAGSYHFQKQIADTLRRLGSGRDRRQEGRWRVTAPPAEGARLKGRAYLSELESAVEELTDG